MGRSGGYQTKQKEAVLDYLISVSGQHVNVNQVVRYFETTGLSIGVTTVYRHLERLAAAGVVKKYRLEGLSGACYQYVKEPSDLQEHYHLKCEVCGQLFHIQCEFIDQIADHLGNHHHFMMNNNKTIFYGICERCS